MKKYKPETVSKLRRLFEKTQIIIQSSMITDELKSDYNSIKNDWNSLNDVIEEWKEINFSPSDFKTEENFHFDKFTEVCKTNMQLIAGICEDILSVTDLTPKENHSKISSIIKIAIPIFTINLTISGIVISSIYSNTSSQLNIRYDQGKSESEIKYKDSIKTLEDSISFYKSKLKECENCCNRRKNRAK